MAFLNKADLFLTILEDELNEIVRSDETLIASACSAAVAEMKIYLNDSYDVDTIFTRTGAARHQLLLNLGADMATYFIVARCQAGQDLTDREARYKRAVATLKAFQKSETYADLPRRATTVQKQVSFKSNPKRGNYF
jgi:Protein of unknown function (DUF1320)